LSVLFKYFERISPGIDRLKTRLGRAFWNDKDRN
jgi:hypothetical protein